MRVTRIPMEQLGPVLDEQLARGEALLPVTWNSMWPMLSGGRDMVRLARPGRPLRPGDTALFRRAGGQYVLHRVIRAEGETLLFCGDSQWQPERVPRERVVALVTAFRRRGRWRSTADSRGYRAYARIWTGGFRLRRPLLGLLGLLRRMKP